MWQAVKDKKRRLAQNYKESRRRSTTGGDTDEDIGIARSIPFDADFVDDRGEFKEYLKATKDIQKKVILHAQQTITFINGWKNMNETYDEMEGGYETSRGEEWLAEVDKFATLAVAQIENAAGTLLEVLKVRYQAAQETQTGIKRLVDRETDLRSYERRVQEAQNAAKPKPETIQKFTLKLEGAKNDCLQQTVTVKADMEYMKKTKLTAHQPQFNEFMKMCMHVSQKVAELSDPAEAIARLARLQEGSSVMGQGKAKAAAAMASVTGMMGGMMGGGGGGGGGSSDAPKKRPSLQGVHGTQPMMHQPPHRSAPVPTSSSSSNEGPPLPPKNNSHMAAFGAAASSGLMSAKSGMDNAKQQAQQHKEQGKKEQKAAAQGMALGYLKGGKGGALKAAKGSATSAAQSHGSALAQNMPPQKSAPTPGGSGPPNKAAPTPASAGGGFYSFDKIKANAVSAQAKLKKNVDKNMEAMKNNKSVLAMSLPMAKALFDFEPENNDELKLKAGEELYNVVDVEDDWMKGTTKDGRVGVFPSNYVERIKAPAIRPPNAK